MPSGTTTTTQNTTAQPYKKAKPLVNTALNDAMRAYSQGIGGQTYTGSTVVPMANQTTQAYGDVSRNATANMGGQGMSGQLQGIIDNGGFNSEQRTALDNFQNTANSSYDMNANPGFQNVLQKAQNDARNQVGMSASAMGRYGSGIAQGNVAREVGNLTDRMVSDDFNRWLGRKDSANQNLFNAAQAGLGNMSSAYGAMQAPATAQLGVGAAYEDLYKRQLDDQLRIFDDRQNAPWNQFNRLMGMGNLTSSYAPKSTVSTAPGQNPLLSTIGGVSTGYGLLGSMGLFG